tara:strand:+ start:2666 stop:3313 length:648 start_codon:yes stop_codon:yes gene_type:complete
MNTQFKNWFESFATHNAVYYVTGSDQPKTLEQLGSQIYNLAIRAYQCSGNDVYEGLRNVHTTNIDWHPHTLGFFSTELEQSEYSLRTGIHAEHRNGMINFSILGRRANSVQRADYAKWDAQTNERVHIAERFNKQFPQYQASVAGEIGIDIVVRGTDKSQIMKDFPDANDIHFFGDMTQPGGNDHELASAVDKMGGVVHSVRDWRDTWDRLKNLR